MSPEVMERTIIALEMRSQYPTPGWAEIARKLGIDRSTLRQQISEYHRNADQWADMRQLVEEHHARMARALDAAEATAREISDPVLRLPALEQWRAMLLAAGRELGLIPEVGRFGNVVNVHAAASAAIPMDATAGMIEQATPEEIEATIDEYIERRLTRALPAPSGNGSNGNHQAADPPPDDPSREV